MKTLSFFAVIGMLYVPTYAFAQTPSPYAGQDQRSIKALSDDEIRDLTEGRGMSLAKAAELNLYPGPLHVLELANKLQLSDAQRASTQALYLDMRARAAPLGVKIIDAERELDRAFAERRINLPEVQMRTGEIGHLQGELRAVHLQTHLAQRAILTPQQTEQYDHLRGYRGNAAASPHQRQH